MYTGNHHWVCVSNKFCGSGEVELFDSKFIAGSLDPCGFIVQQLCAILHSQSEAITIKVIDIQHQTGCSDCGLFALAFAADLVENEDPFTRSYFQSKLRSS